MSQNVKNTLDLIGGGGFADAGTPLATTSNFTPSATHGEDGLRRKFGLGNGGPLSAEEYRLNK